VLIAACALTARAGQNYQVYVSNEKSGDVTVIGGRDNDVLATIPVGTVHAASTASPDGKTVYVAWRHSP